MRRLVVPVVVGAMLAVSIPAKAQEVAPRLDLSEPAMARALGLAHFSEGQQSSSVSEASGGWKAAYFAALGFAAAGVIYNIKTTRDALDHGLEARTFPLVWQKTKDPKDKNKVSALIASTNGALLGVGAFVYKRGDPKLATFINLLVGGATMFIGVHNKGVIDDCTPSTCIQ